MRIDRMDKLDRINFYQAMHSNLVKWWCINMVDPEDMIEGTEEALLTDMEDGDAALVPGREYDADAMAEELLADALGKDSDNMYMDENEDPFAGMDPEAASAAMEIFNRLQAEAAADEAAKQAEIEAARLAAT